MKSIPFHKLYKTEESSKGIGPQHLESAWYAKNLVEQFRAMGFRFPLLTDSCTRALEIVAQVIDLQPDDEVIVPAYGYPTTADVFAQKGATLVFADSQENHPNMSLATVQPVLTPQTKAIVSIHYGGVSTDAEALRKLCDKRGIYFIEDNAHGIGCHSLGRSLGTFGHFSATSFHRTKNIHGFNGGMLNINQPELVEPCLRYFNKGTDRALFETGSVPYYQWTGHGSSCEMNAMGRAFLWQHIQLLQEVNTQQVLIWQRYQNAFEKLPWNFIADAIATKTTEVHNAHVYPICFKSVEERDRVKALLASKGISAYPHYNSLDRSHFGKQWKTKDCVHADNYSNGLLRLPIYPDLTTAEVDYIIAQTQRATADLS